MIYFPKLRRMNPAIFFNGYLFQDSSVQRFRWKAVLLGSLTSSLLKGERPYVLPLRHTAKSWVNKPRKADV